MLGILELDRERHFVVELEVTKNLRRLLCCPDIMTYKHLESGRTVVGIWRSRLAGTIQELPLSFWHQAQVGPQDIDDLMYVGSDAHSRELDRQIYELERQALNEAKEKMEEARERAERRKSWHRTNQRKMGNLKADKLSRWYEWNDV